jgi:dihydroorotate dehydrogenase (NAD+) catalytic subunit
MAMPRSVLMSDTLRGMAMDPARPGEPWLGGGERSGERSDDERRGEAGDEPKARQTRGSGGVSGPAVRAVALSLVREVRARVALPVVGMGGVQSARHAADLRAAGADLVAVGTESFRDPLAAARVAAGLEALEAGLPANAARPPVVGRA